MMKDITTYRLDLSNDTTKHPMLYHTYIQLDTDTFFFLRIYPQEFQFSHQPFFLATFT